MPSFGVWRRVDVVDWTDVSEDRIASTPQKTAFFIVTAVKTSNPTIFHQLENVKIQKKIPCEASMWSASSLMYQLM
jgi:hypothetical protein